MKKIVKYAFINALGTALYIMAVVSLVFFLSSQSWIDGENDTILTPIVILMLLVFSVALVGSLIFGRPAMWYVDGNKKDALMLLAWTLVIFFVILVFVIFGLVVVGVRG